MFISQAALDKLAEDTAVAATSPDAAPTAAVEGTHIIYKIAMFMLYFSIGFVC